MMNGLRAKILGIKSLKNSEFVKNTFTIFSGNVVAQAIPFLIEPIIARMYSPSDFAVLAVYISVANLFSIIATARYEMAIMLPADHKKAINILALSLFITLLISVLSLIVVWIFNTQITQILQSPELGTYLFFVPVSVFITGWYQSLNYWSIRQKRFKNVTYARVSQTVSNSGFNLAFGFAQLKSLGLMLAFFIGQVVSIVPLLYRFVRNDWKNLHWINRQEMKLQAIEHQDFPKINSIHAFSDIIQQSTVVFLISSFFGQLTLGLYSRTMRLLFAPASVIGSAIGQVFYQKASVEFKQNGTVKTLVVRTLRNLALISIPIFSLTMFFGDAIFAFVLGENWRVAGEFAQILSPWICLSFIIAPISQIPLIVGKQKAAFLRSLIGNGLIIVSVLFAGLIAKDIKVGFYLLSSLEVIYYSYLVYWFVKIS
jgi:O-antigen/teichoic acid export membrane protein